MSVPWDVTWSEKAFEDLNSLDNRLIDRVADAVEATHRLVPAISKDFKASRLRSGVFGSGTGEYASLLRLPAMQSSC